mmetsp:Transcript_7435/g.16853  ORF Transcript_7435/g.16853 Transcript_7435/m.16853 type:complete len:171 (+) Transcript_7435:82-594(+)
MRSALRQLCRHGIEALRPQKNNAKWRPPVISKRVAADLRKMAIRNGTYGKFDTETGIGWDPVWDAPKTKVAKNDILLANINNNNTAEEDTDMAVVDDLLTMGSNQGGIQSIRPPKGHKRERTRESRAQKIENLLAQADEKIEEYRLEREGKKPKPGIAEEFKRIAKKSSW